MLEALLVLAVLLGTIAMYALARRFGVHQAGSGILAAECAGVAVIVAVIAFSIAGRYHARAASDVAASAAAPPASAPPASAPSPTAMSIAEVRGLRPAGRGTQGSIDRIRVSPATAGAYDAERRIVQAHRGAEITVEGWGQDASVKLPGAGVAALIDGQIVATGLYGFDRDDVAKYFGNPAMRFSGYRIQLGADTIGAGNHVLSVAVIAADHKGYEPLSTRVNFVVVP